jgi:CBS domain-containing protein
MEIRDIMSRPVVTVSKNATMAEVAQTLLREHVGAVVVVDERERAIGVLTERDFVPHPAGHPFDPHRAPRVFGRSVMRYDLEELYREARILPAHKAMRKLPASLSPDDTLQKASDLMLRHSVNHVVVLDGRLHPVGMVSRHDLVRAVVQIAADAMKEEPLAA